MIFKSQVISKVIAIIALTNIAPLIFPQTTLIIAIIALTKIVPLVFSQVALSNLINLSRTLKDFSNQYPDY